MNQSQNNEALQSIVDLASPADVLRGSSDVRAPRGAGTRDEPLRTSAWEATVDPVNGMPEENPRRCQSVKSASLEIRYDYKEAINS